MSFSLKKTSLTVFMASALLLVLMLFSGCSANVTKIEINQSSIPAFVTVGEEVDFGRISATVTFSDGTTRQAGYAELNISKPDITTEGEKEVTVSYLEDEFTTTFTLEVVSENVTPYQAVYDGTSHSLAEVTGTKDTDTVLYSETSAGEFTTTPIEKKDAGTYTIFVKIERQDKSTLEYAYTSVISKRELSLSFPKTFASITYGDELTANGNSTEVKITGLQADDIAESVFKEGALPKISTNYTAGSDVGTYAIKIESGTLESTNYYVTNPYAPTASRKYTVTVNKKKITEFPTELEVSEFTYDKIEKTVTVTGLTDFMVLSGNTATNAGTYTATITPISSNYIFDNGTTQSTELTFTYVIKQIVLNITWDETNSWKYDANFHQRKATLDETGILEDDEVELVLTGQEQNVGSYTTTASLSNSNYKINESINLTEEYSITKATNEWITIPQFDSTKGALAKDENGQDIVQAKFGAASISYRLKAAEGEEENEWQNSPTVAGTYEVRVYVAGTDNYDELEYLPYFEYIKE